VVAGCEFLSGDQRKGGAVRRHLVIVARDRPDLWVTWAAFYGGAERVEVLLDRRQGPARPRGQQPERRGRTPRGTALQERGFLVIPQADGPDALR
jgi:hypothetical protein